MTAALQRSLLWLIVVLPSLAVVGKYAGAGGIVAYGVAVALALSFTPVVFRRLPRDRVTILAAATWLILVLGFGIVYPRVNTTSPTAGSDDDDAHDVGVAAILSGQSPYGRLTYLDNELYPLPGAYVLAAPFVVTGGASRQALFWLPLFFLVVRRRVIDVRTPLLLAWVVGLSAAVLHEVVTGSSYSSSTIAVLLGIGAVVWSRGHWAAALFCGIAMCSRVNFVLLIAPLWTLLWRTAGIRMAIRVTAIVVAVFVALLVPFEPWGHTFPPVTGGMARLRILDIFATGASTAVVVATAIVTVVLSSRVSTERQLFLYGGAIQAAPIVLGMVIGSQIGADVVGLFLPYGTFASWFLLAGLAPRIEAWWLANQSTRLAPM
jgi:hypothetical protein